MSAMDQLVAAVCLSALAIGAAWVLWSGFHQMRERSRCPQCGKLGLRSAGNVRSFWFQAILGGSAPYTYVCRHCGFSHTVEQDG